MSEPPVRPEDRGDGHRRIRIALAIPFWLLQVWWLGHPVYALWTGQNGTFYVYSVSVNGVIHDGWGLTFAGRPGFVLAGMYIAVVFGALLGLTLGVRAVQRSAAVILIAWGVLFLGNSFWLLQYEPWAWWDWVNLGGVAIVLAHASLAVRRRRPGSTR